MNIIKYLIETYKKGLEYDNLEEEYKATLELNSFLEEQLISLREKKQKEDEQFKQAIYDLEKEIEECHKTIEELEKSGDDKLKEYWYNKYPKKKSYALSGKRLKQYCLEKNDKVPVVTGKNIDSIANSALLMVIRTVTYVGDPKEHWQFANETVERKKGDCEDGAILLYNIMVKSGVPAWRIRLNAGEVKHPSANKTAGHAYITYLREADNQWYILDWCYWADESKNFRKRFTDAKKYFSVWVSWNSDYAWVSPDYKQ